MSKSEHMFDELASWVVASEFCRRFPENRVFELHPGGGLYDMLSVRDGELNELFAINRGGSLHFSAVDVEQDSRWSESIRDNGSRALLDRICRHLHRPVPATLPRTKRHVLVYRVIAESLRLTMLRPTHVTWVSGFHDTSGESGGPADHLFGPFPGARKAVQARQEDDPLGEPAYRFWFAVAGNEPLCALDTSAQLYLGDGTPRDFMKAYQGNRNVTDLVASQLSPSLMT